jgi:hypothetical protein
MRHIDECALIIQQPDELLSEPAQTSIAPFETTIAKSVPQVVRQLHDPYTEAIENLQALQLFVERIGVLEIVDDRSPTLRVRFANIACRQCRHDLAPKS